MLAPVYFPPQVKKDSKKKRSISTKASGSNPKLRKSETRTVKRTLSKEKAVG